MKRIKKGDNVIVTVGKSKGQVGKVMRVLGDSILVEGLNLIKKHVKPNPQLEQPGGIIYKEAPIHVSNVALYNSITQKGGKIGFKVIEKDGKEHKVRYFKSNNEIIDLV